VNAGPFIPIGLGLGSNMGDRPGYICQAIYLLRQASGIELKSISSLYRSKPWGFTEQEDFANLCAIGQTAIEPKALLVKLKAIEVKIGRAPSQRWGPRQIDIDLLFYGNLHLQTPELELPHPEIFARAFVLVPLAEIAPALVLQNRSIAEAGKAMDQAAIMKWRRRQSEFPA